MRVVDGLSGSVARVMRARGSRATIALCIVTIGIVTPWAAGSILMRGHPAVVPNAAAPAIDLTIDASDGITIAATYRPGRRPNAPAVLLLHGVRASRNATTPTAIWLAQDGYATLAIDFRGHGRSTLTTRSFGLHESVDAHAAFGWFKRRQDGAAVAVIGTSLGGAASLLGDAGPIPAEALILQAVYPDIRRAVRHRIAAYLGSAVAYALEPLLSFQSVLRFGAWPSDLSPLRALRRFSGPVLVIGGLHDVYTPPDETRELAAAADGQIWLVEEGDHAQMGELDHPDYRERVRRFLKETIGLP